MRVSYETFSANTKAPEMEERIRNLEEQIQRLATKMERN
jgi:hypothetical protein